MDIKKRGGHSHPACGFQNENIFLSDSDDELKPREKGLHIVVAAANF